MMPKMLPFIAFLLLFCLLPSSIFAFDPEEPSLPPHSRRPIALLCGTMNSDDFLRQLNYACIANKTLCLVHSDEDVTGLNNYVPFEYPFVRKYREAATMVFRLTGKKPETDMKKYYDIRGIAYLIYKSIYAQYIRDKAILNELIDTSPDFSNTTSDTDTSDTSSLSSSSSWEYSLSSPFFPVLSTHDILKTSELMAKLAEFFNEEWVDALMPIVLKYGNLGAYSDSNLHFQQAVDLSASALLSIFNTTNTNRTNQGYTSFEYHFQHSGIQKLYLVDFAEFLIKFVEAVSEFWFDAAKILDLPEAAEEDLVQASTKLLTRLSESDMQLEQVHRTLLIQESMYEIRDIFTAHSLSMLHENYNPDIPFVLAGSYYNCESAVERLVSTERNLTGKFRYDPPIGYTFLDVRQQTYLTYNFTPHWQPEPVLPIVAPALRKFMLQVVDGSYFKNDTFTRHLLNADRASHLDKTSSGLEFQYIVIAPRNAFRGTVYLTPHTSATSDAQLTALCQRLKTRHALFAGCFKDVKTYRIDINRIANVFTEDSNFWPVMEGPLPPRRTLFQPSFKYNSTDLIMGAEPFEVTLLQKTLPILLGRDNSTAATNMKYLEYLAFGIWKNWYEDINYPKIRRTAIHIPRHMINPFESDSWIDVLVSYCKEVSGDMTDHSLRSFVEFAESDTIQMFDGFLKEHRSNSNMPNAARTMAQIISSKDFRTLVTQLIELHVKLTRDPAVVPATATNRVPLRVSPFLRRQFKHYIVSSTATDSLVVHLSAELSHWAWRMIMAEIADASAMYRRDRTFRVTMNIIASLESLFKLMESQFAETPYSLEEFQKILDDYDAKSLIDDLETLANVNIARGVYRDVFLAEKEYQYLNRVNARPDVGLVLAVKPERIGWVTDYLEIFDLKTIQVNSL